MVIQTIDLFLFSLTALFQRSALDDNLSLWAAPLFPLSRTIRSGFHQCVGLHSHYLATSPVKKLVLEFTLAKAWLHVFCVAYLNIHVPVSLLLCFYVNVSQRISLKSHQSQSRVRGVKLFIHTWYKTGFVSDQGKQTHRKDSAVNPYCIFSFSFDFPFFAFCQLL